MSWAVKQIQQNLPPLAHSPMYIWHKFWARKTWNVVGEHIESYCPPGGIVLDPYVGSGVTVVEALRRGRRVIACDLLPVATDVIIRLTITPVDLLALSESFRRVEKSVSDRIRALYETTCRKCRSKVVAKCYIWEGDSPVEVRYECESCGHRCLTDCALKPNDKQVLRNIEKSPIEVWYPTNHLAYPDGTPFLKREHYSDIPSLFTKRNLLASAILLEEISKEPDSQLRHFLRGCFSSMVHLATKMMPVGNPQPTNHYTFFSSPGWTQHSYWSVPRFMEQNVWDKFDSAFNGAQGLFRAKQESLEELRDVKIASHPKQVFEGKRNVYIYTGSCFDLLSQLPDESIDYVFTDPPYAGSVQYGELAFLWAAWLGLDGYLSHLGPEEVVVNSRQAKSFEAYSGLLQRSFNEIQRVLRPKLYATITFHNPAFKVRNQTIRAARYAGFEFEKIYHQQTAQDSPKAMLQPFGSALGDFYMRFRKTEAPSGTVLSTDEIRFEKIIVEATTRVLAERSTPTPYGIIINYIDPELAKAGYFSKLESGLDVARILKKHLGKEFKLVTVELGGKKGKMWWFNDESLVRLLKEVPLEERVEQTVLRVLRAGGRVTFTEVWKRVSEEFPNALTPDSTSIRESLEKYARPVARGFWLLRPEVAKREGEHTIVIESLAQIGKALGYRVWIGRPEQGAIGSTGRRLGAYVDVDLKSFLGAKEERVVGQMDVLWIRGGRIEAAFEVEATTAMTDALLRGSHLDGSVPKYMIIPEEREKDYARKMRHPMFAQHAREENWHPIHFDTLLAFRARLAKGELSLDALSKRRARIRKLRKRPGGKQQRLRGIA